MLTEIERVVDDEASPAVLPCRFEHEGSRVITARDDGRDGVSRPYTESAAALIVEDREQQRCRIDAWPAEPCDVAIRIDERCGPRVGEESVLADRMLHPVSLDHRCGASGYPMRMNSDVAMWSLNEVVLLPIARTGVRYGATC